MWQQKQKHEKCCRRLNMLVLLGFYLLGIQTTTMFVCNMQNPDHFLFKSAVKKHHLLSVGFLWNAAAIPGERGSRVWLYWENREALSLLSESSPCYCCSLRRKRSDSGRLLVGQPEFHSECVGSGVEVGRGHSRRTGWRGQRSLFDAVRVLASGRGLMAQSRCEEEGRWWGRGELRPALDVFARTAVCDCFLSASRSWSYNPLCFWSLCSFF